MNQAPYQGRGTGPDLVSNPFAPGSYYSSVAGSATLVTVYVIFRRHFTVPRVVRSRSWKLFLFWVMTHRR